MNSALKIRLTEIKFVCASAYSTVEMQFLINLNQNSATILNGVAWDRGRKSKKVMKSLVTSNVLKKHTGHLLNKLAFQKAFMLQHRLTSPCNNKDMTHDMIQPSNIF